MTHAMIMLIVGTVLIGLGLHFDDPAMPIMGSVLIGVGGYIAVRLDFLEIDLISKRNRDY